MTRETALIQQELAKLLEIWKNDLLAEIPQQRLMGAICALKWVLSPTDCSPTEEIEALRQLGRDLAKRFAKE